MHRSCINIRFLQDYGNKQLHRGGPVNAPAQEKTDKTWLFHTLMFGQPSAAYQQKRSSD